jgi:hypothetical protein
MLKRLRDHCHRVLPMLPQTWRDRFDRIPARYKRFCFVVWVGWKFVALFLVLYVWPSSQHDHDQHQHHQPPERHLRPAAASATQLHPPLKSQPQAAEERPESPPKVLMLVTTPSSSLLSMYAAVTRTVAVLDDFDVHVRWIVGDADDENDAEDDEDNEDNDATADDADHIYWRDATPLYGGSLYRQERFVIKDALSAMMAIGTAAATASSSTAFYDVVMALYRDDVIFLSNDVLHEYIRTSRRLLLDRKNEHDRPHATVVVPHLPLVVSPDSAAAAGTTPDVMDHPALGLARVYNDSATSSTTVPPLWGWMATPEQLFVSYHQGNFPLPPLEDAVAMNNDDALYVFCYLFPACPLLSCSLPSFVLLTFDPSIMHNHPLHDTAGNAVLITVCRSYCPSPRNDNDVVASVARGA